VTHLNLVRDLRIFVLVVGNGQSFIVNIPTQNINQGNLKIMYQNPCHVQNVARIYPYLSIAKGEKGSETRDMNAEIEANNKKSLQLRMGSEKKQKKVGSKVSFKTLCIKEAGGYGGYQKVYRSDPFETTEREAKRLFQKVYGRNSLCLCGSKQKFKRCCLR